MKKIYALTLLAFLLIPVLALAQVAILSDEPTPPETAAAAAKLGGIWITAAVCAIIAAVVQSVKGFLQKPWAVFVLNLVHLGVIVPYIPVALNVLASLAAFLAMYGVDGLTGPEVWQLVLFIFGADGIKKLLSKKKEIVPNTVKVR